MEDTTNPSVPIPKVRDYVQVIAKQCAFAIHASWRLNKTPINRRTLYLSTRGRLYYRGVALTDVLDALLDDYGVTVIITSNGWDLYLPVTAIETDRVRIEQVVESYELMGAPGHHLRNKAQTLEVQRRKAEKKAAKYDREFDSMCEELPPLVSKASAPAVQSLATGESVIESEPLPYTDEPVLLLD